MTNQPPPLPAEESRDDIDAPPGKPAPKSRPRIFTILGLIAGVVIGLPLLALMSLGILMELHITPDSEANPGAKVEKRVRPLLESLGLLDQDEKLIYFYSGGVLSYREDGNYFTDQRVVSYTEIDGEIVWGEATYPEIEEIDAEMSESFLEDSLITIYCENGTAFDLWVSNSEGGDKKFLRRLKEEWQKKRSR